MSAYGPQPVDITEQLGRIEEKLDLINEKLSNGEEESK